MRGRCFVCGLSKDNMLNRQPIPGPMLENGKQIGYYVCEDYKAVGL